MKSVKHIAYWLCLVLVLSLFSACQSGSTTTADPAPAEPAATEPADPVENPAEDSGEQPAASAKPAELQTIRFSTSYYNAADPNWTDPSFSPMIGVLEEATNVHIEWEIITAEETYNLMIASGDYCDIIAPMVAYPGGYGKAVEDGVFMEMTDVVKDYMPNYAALVNGNEQIYREAVADDGSMPVVYTIICDDAGMPIPSQQANGLMVRADWLETLDMELPETIADWDATLTAFRDRMGADAPLLIGSDGTLQCGAFVSAYGILSEFYLDGDTVKYGPAEEGYRQWLELFSDWYSRGLINRDYPAAAGEKIFASFDYIGTGRSGAGNQLIAMCDKMLFFMGMAQDPGFMLQPIQNPVLNEGDIPTRAEYNSYLYSAVAFSSSCSNVSAAAYWLDYLYSYDGMLLANYGLEEEAYYFTDDGEIRFTEAILNPPAGVLSSDVQSLYNLGLHIGLSDTDTYNKNLTPVQADGIDMFTEMDNSMVLPTTMSLSVEESEEISGTYGDIQTYVNEMTNKFITGAASMEEYDAFVESLYVMRLQDCIDAYQAAYDRFIAR